MSSTGEEKPPQDGKKTPRDGEEVSKKDTAVSSTMSNHKRKHSSSPPLVSVIMPVYNAEAFLEEAFESIRTQTYRPLEVVCFNDCSTDESWNIIQSWQKKFSDADITSIFLSSSRDTASGPGYGRNQAIQSSHGEYLCHLGV
jgi:cellulose synthase/poly-beta-1,6-N-acetylglucosamine synthase-like glycosyltransferase